jgi:2'-5' RNA ligase
MVDKKQEQLYFIAIIPPEPVYTEAQKLKQYFKDTYHSEAALNSPPHITLHMPFRWKESKEHLLVTELARFGATQPALELTLNNFSAFEPRVIFLDLVKSEPLETLQKLLKRFCKQKLNLFNADYKELAFHPHLTLAFRDLKKPAFYQAWSECKDKKFEATFLVNTLALLKHDGKTWKTFKEISLLAE